MRCRDRYVAGRSETKRVTGDGFRRDPRGLPVRIVRTHARNTDGYREPCASCTESVTDTRTDIRCATRADTSARARRTINADVAARSDVDITRRYETTTLDLDDRLSGAAARRQSQIASGFQHAPFGRRDDQIVPYLVARRTQRDFDVEPASMGRIGRDCFVRAVRAQTRSRRGQCLQTGVSAYRFRLLSEIGHALWSGDCRARDARRDAGLAESVGLVTLQLIVDRRNRHASAGQRKIAPGMQTTAFDTQGASRANIKITLERADQARRVVGGLIMQPVTRRADTRDNRRGLAQNRCVAGKDARFATLDFNVPTPHVRRRRNGSIASRDKLDVVASGDRCSASDQIPARADLNRIG